MEHLFYYSVVNIVARFGRKMKPNGVKFLTPGGASSGAPHQPGGPSWLRRAFSYSKKRGSAASLRSVADIYCIGALRRYTTLQFSL